MSLVLLIEDQPQMRKLLKVSLIRNAYEVDEAESIEAATRLLYRKDYDVVLLDLKLPDGNGLTLFDKFKDKLSDRTLIITADASIPSVVEAIKKGAFNYLLKSVDLNLLNVQVEKICQKNELYALLRRNRSVVEDAASAYTFEKIVFKSKAMERVIERAKILAKTENTILIQGETGSGKEILAHAIHRESPRKNEILLPVNCAAIPSELFESELFGFEKGAFTGAIENYSGRFIQAEKGSLFLDEMAELPLHIQAKLLRVLDERVIFRLKSPKPIPINLRLIAATNRDLEKEIQYNRFRSDLYFRLQESIVSIPPLRQRIDDIVPLCHHYIGIYNTIYNKNVSRISAEVEAYFMNYSWPGNVRELKNIIKSIIPFKKDNTIAMEDLSYASIRLYPQKHSGVLTLEEIEKQHVNKVLVLTGYNILRTSELLGISRSRLYRKMKKFGFRIHEEMMDQESERDDRRMEFDDEPGD